MGSYIAPVDVFPIGYIAWPNAPAVPAGWAWSVAILPQLEQSTWGSR